MEKIQVTSKSSIQHPVRHAKPLLVYFYTLHVLRVEEVDVGQLLVGKEQLGKEITEICVKFKVEGQHEGRYTAVIATYDDDMFSLDAVYRDTDTKNKARLSIALPG